MEIYKIELQKQYLKQIGEDWTDENIKEYGLDYDCMRLISETKTYWSVEYYESTPMGNHTVLNVVYKDGRSMQSLEV